MDEASGNALNQILNNAVEFFCKFNCDPNEEDRGEGPSEMFRFEKVMN